nr:hypothetical protein GCM10020093_019440 [Planobispora longispora]
MLARVDPATKLELVRALRAGGEVVTMTGDGVNDAPALRHADVGVAMAGDEGTDVAREAASVVVTNGELGTIVTGVRHGRRLHHNVASMIGYLLTGNLAEIFLVLVGLLLWPDLVVPLLPVHLLWINLVLDGIPAIALGIDRPAGDPLSLRPRRGGLLSRPAVTEMALRALLIGALVFAAVEIARQLGWSQEQVRTQAVLALVFARLTLAYVTRARRWTFERGWWHGRAVLIAVAATLALQVLVTLAPPLGALLALVSLPPLGWAMAVAAGLATPFLCDLLRLARPRGAGPLMRACQERMLRLCTGKNGPGRFRRPEVTAESGGFHRRAERGDRRFHRCPGRSVADLHTPGLWSSVCGPSAPSPGDRRAKR